jgi:hypothetical protein
MKTPRPLRAASAALLLIAIIGLPVRAAAQDPIVKPSSDPLLTARLPAPAPTARQVSTGCGGRCLPAAKPQSRFRTRRNPDMWIPT